MITLYEIIATGQVGELALAEWTGYSIVRDVSPKYLRHKDPKLHHPLGGL